MNITRCFIPAFLFLASLAIFTSPACASDWTALGGNAGMTKYSPDDIAAALTLDYTKMFYSPYCNDDSNDEGYWYGSTILINNGTAAVFNSDTYNPNGQRFGTGVPLTLFNYSTGVTTSTTVTPSTTAWANLPLPSGTTYVYASGRYSIHQGESDSEIDSGHDTESIVWGADGNIYARHGGDNAVTVSFNPTTNTWTRLAQYKASPSLSNYNSQFEGDANAFLQTYGTQLIYRPGDTRQSSPYISVNIAPGAVTSDGIPGPYLFDVGPTGTASPDGLFYGDIPKVTTAMVNGVSTPISIVSGLVDAAYPNSVQTQATNLTTGQTLWTSTYGDNGGGQTGFYTSTSNYWRFVAANNGTYLMDTGAGTVADPRVVRDLNAATGASIWTAPLPVGTSNPLLATNGNTAYVVGPTGQMKVNLSTGAPIWQTTHVFNTDSSYYASFEDPVYRPMVLTDSTLWFISGVTGTDAMLIGLQTSDGSILQQIDLSTMVSATPGQTLLQVDDMAEINGELSVLVGIGLTNDPNPDIGPGGGVARQALFTFDSVPEPGSFALIAITSVALLGRRRRV